MHSVRNFIIAVFLSFLGAAGAAAAAADTHTVAILVSGEVPGFTPPQLSAYLAQKMQEEVAAPWHFVADAPVGAANRVVWSFKILRKIWKGGSHEGFPSPAYSISYLRAEVKLYLNGNYQMTMDTHPSVLSGPDDKALSDMVHDAAHALFIENRTDAP